VKKRILLADRSSSLERMVAGALTGCDVEVTAVTDGYAAERILIEGKPDLVLADVFLLGKSGYEICGFIKQDTRLAGLPVILLVGQFEPFDAATAARLGADGKLTKPIEPAGLIDLVGKLLGHRDSESGVSEPLITAVPAMTASLEAGPFTPDSLSKIG
jgi:CheY-like chemotaxis protein